MRSIVDPDMVLVVGLNDAIKLATTTASTTTAATSLQNGFSGWDDR